MNLKTSLSLSILFISVIGLASPELDNLDSHYMPCIAYMDYDINGKLITKVIKPAYVTTQEWANKANNLIEKELIKKGVTKKQLDHISKMQEIENTEYSPLHDIPYDFATGLWHIGKGLYCLSYEVGKGFVFISVLAGEHIIIPLSKASLYYVWQTLKSLLYTNPNPSLEKAPRAAKSTLLSIKDEEPLLAIKNN